MATTEKDFEKFFNSLKNQKFSYIEIQSICKPLSDYYRVEKIKKCVLILLILGIISSSIMWIDSFNWLLSAIGRILLIQLLPYWNWPELYNAKCLIDIPIEVNNKASTFSKLNRYETYKENCFLCDSMDYIPSVKNTTSTILENSYLVRGFPVIITDSQDPIPPSDIFHLIFNKSLEFLKSNPCDVSSNLMLNKFFDIEIALRKAWSMYYSPDKWFLQLRNCQFEAVKSSRLFIKRPYYYPIHLEPYYSSWLIMSQNYSHRKPQEIYLQGLIILQQIWGSLNVSLKPKMPCDESCPIISVQLKDGESLIFSTDLWSLSYQFGNDNQQCITTIMEIEWNI